MNNTVSVARCTDEKDEFQRTKSKSSSGKRINLKHLSPKGKEKMKVKD